MVNMKDIGSVVQEALRDVANAHLGGSMSRGLGPERVGVLATTVPHEYHSLLHEVDRQIPGAFARKSPDRVFEHEEDHAKVFRRLGETVIYGIDFVRLHNSDGSVSYSMQPYAGVNRDDDFTPVQNAAMLLHPETPSRYDLARVHELGFVGMQDVVGAIREYNSLHTENEQLPLPRSYTGT